MSPPRNRTQRGTLAGSSGTTERPRYDILKSLRDYATVSVLAPEPADFTCAFVALTTEREQLISYAAA